MAINKNKIQDLLMNDPTSSGKDAVIMTALSDIEEVANDIQDSVRDIDFRDVDFVKGEKGDKGEQGEQGIQGVQGIQGATGQIGLKGDKGDKGDKGEDGLNADEEYIVERVLELIPEHEEIVFDNAEQLRDKLETLKGDERLDISAIAGLEKVIKELKKKSGGTTQIFGGGGNKEAYKISLDTSNFDNNLDSSITDVQKLADAVDELASSGGTFKELTDTPADYTGHAGKFAKVKSDESGLEFGSGDGVGDMLKATYDTNDNGKVDNAEKVNGLTVETAVPAGALFTDTVYDDTSIQAEVDSNTSKVSADGSINTHSDVDTTGEADGKVLTYNSATGKYEPTTPASGVTDHGLLTGLGDDDHTQYHTDGRADTWLGTKDTDDLSEGTSNLYYPSADKSKLAGVESNATADQTDAEIKTAYENNSDTNAYTDTEKSKLSGIESGADKTDATNVNNAGAVMNSDTSTSAMSFVVDEDDMTSDSATKVPTQQSVKAYVDNNAGGGGSSVDIVAEGALSNGDKVIVNSNGKVEVVGVLHTGAESVFNSGTTNYTSATFDSNLNKVVIAYQDQSNSNYGTAIVGTVSGTSISFGSESVFNSGATYDISATFDSNLNKVVIAYQDQSNSNYGTAIVGTVSGTSISFGSESVFYSGSTYQTSISTTFDTNSNVVVVVYTDDSHKGTAKVCSISGTTISFGSGTVFHNYEPHYTSATFDSNLNKVVIAYRDSAYLYGRAVVGTVSGTSISFGSVVTFLSYSAYSISIAFDSNSNKVVIAYQDGNSGYGTAIIGTVSGTSISFGTAITFNSGSTSFTSTTFDSNLNKVVIAYRDAGNSSYGTAIVGTVSGTSISFGSESVFNSGDVSWIYSCFDDDSNQVVIAYKDESNSNYGTSIIFDITGATNLTTSNFLGISSGAYSDTATATIQVVGAVDDAQSGLTAGNGYYVQGDGTLDTTADTVDVYVGVALSATKLLLK